MEVVDIKTTIVGDGAVGKSCLLTRMVKNDFEWDDNAGYTPTAAHNVSLEVDTAAASLKFDIWDTAGQESLRQLRLAAYPGTDILMVAFDTTKAESLENVVSEDGWIAEVKSVVEQEDEASNYSIILIGTKYDLWKEMQAQNPEAEDLVTREAATKVAQDIGAVAHIWTSAKTGQGLVPPDGRPDDDLYDMDMWYKHGEEDLHQLAGLMCNIGVRLKLDSGHDTLRDSPDKRPAPTPAAAPVAAPVTAPARSAEERSPKDDKSDAGCCNIA